MTQSKCSSNNSFFRLFCIQKDKNRRQIPKNGWTNRKCEYQINRVGERHQWGSLSTGLRFFARFFSIFWEYHQNNVKIKLPIKATCSLPQIVTDLSDLPSNVCYFHFFYFFHLQMNLGISVCIYRRIRIGSIKNNYLKNCTNKYCSKHVFHSAIT